MHIRRYDMTQTGEGVPVYRYLVTTDDGQVWDAALIHDEGGYRSWLPDVPAASSGQPLFPDRQQAILAAVASRQSPHHLALVG